MPYLIWKPVSRRFWRTKGHQPPSHGSWANEHQRSIVSSWEFLNHLPHNKDTYIFGICAFLASCPCVLAFCSYSHSKVWFHEVIKDATWEKQGSNERSWCGLTVYILLFHIGAFDHDSLQGTAPKKDVLGIYGHTFVCIRIDTAYFPGIRDQNGCNQHGCGPCPLGDIIKWKLVIKVSCWFLANTDNRQWQILRVRG